MTTDGSPGPPDQPASETGGIGVGAAGPLTSSNDSGREAKVLYRATVRATPRVVASAAGLVAIYYLLPLDHCSTWVAVVILVTGLVLLIGLIALQVRLITRHPYPGLRAAEALATSIPLFLLLFASTYVFMANVSFSNFGERLTHTDALYFAVTVFSTVGYGDITAKSEAARLVVTGQMIADLIILGLGIRVIVGAVGRGQRRRHGDDGGAAPAG